MIGLSAAPPLHSEMSPWDSSGASLLSHGLLVPQSLTRTSKDLGAVGDRSFGGRSLSWSRC